MFTVWILLILGVSSYPKHVDTTNDHGGWTNASTEGSRRFASPHQNHGKQLITRSEDPWIDCNWISIGLGNSFITADNRDDMLRIKRKCEKLKADRKKDNKGKRGDKRDRDRKKKKPKKGKDFQDEYNYPEYMDSESNENVGSLYPKYKREVTLNSKGIPDWLDKKQKELFPNGQHTFRCIWLEESNGGIFNTANGTKENFAKRCARDDAHMKELLKKFTPEVYERKKEYEKNNYWFDCEWLNRTNVGQTSWFKKPYYDREKDFEESCGKFKNVTTTTDKSLPTTTTTKKPSPTTTTTTKKPSPTTTTTTKKPSPTTTTTEKPWPTTTTTEKPWPTTTSTEKPWLKTTTTENLSLLIAEIGKPDEDNASGLIHDIYLSDIHNDYRINPTGNKYMPGSNNFYHTNQVIHNYGKPRATTKYYGLMGKFGQKYNKNMLPTFGGSAQAPPKKNLLWG